MDVPANPINTAHARPVHYLAVFLSLALVAFSAYCSSRHHPERKPHRPLIAVVSSMTRFADTHGHPPATWAELDAWCIERG